MKFIEAVKEILASANRALSPQEIRIFVKEKYPQFFATSSHKKNVEKGHFADLEHALLAQIYSCVKSSKYFSCDTSCKPMKVFLGINRQNNTSTNLSTIQKTKIKNEDDLISNIDHYYKKSLDVLRDFGGPSIHFHVQAIKEQGNNFLSNRHIELIYATLASWGMHKMGDPEKTKAKMVSFQDFNNSILQFQDDLKKLSFRGMHLCNQEEFEACIDELENIYYNLKVSISEATIVGNSKTLAHILPNLIPPIDRQYTVRFFTQEYKGFFSESGKFKPIVLPQGIKAQFLDFKNYCCKIKSMFDKCNNSIFTINKESFNTSYPKIMDNVIMAFVKEAIKTKSLSSK